MKFSIFTAENKSMYFAWACCNVEKSDTNDKDSETYSLGSEQRDTDKAFQTDIKQ